MKASFTLAALLVAAFLGLGTSAQAKLAPVEPETSGTAVSLDETIIDSGPSRAMLESSYFNAPSLPFPAGRIFQCRSPTNLFSKMRIARSCD